MGPGGNLDASRILMMHPSWVLMLFHEYSWCIVSTHCGRQWGFDGVGYSLKKQIAGCLGGGIVQRDVMFTTTNCNETQDMTLTSTCSRLAQQGSEAQRNKE